MFLSVEWAKRWLPAVFLLLSLFLPWWTKVIITDGSRWSWWLYLSFPWNPDVHMMIGLGQGGGAACHFLATIYEIPYLGFVSASILIGGLCGLSGKSGTRSLGGLLGIVGVFNYFIFVFRSRDIMPEIAYLQRNLFGITHYRNATFIWFLSVGFYLALAGSLLLLLPLIKTLIERLRKRLVSMRSQ